MVDIFVGYDLLDVGYGMPVTVSSAFGPAPSHLIPAADAGAPFFRTGEEQNPSITVDLQCVRRIRRIRVFNNESEPPPTVPLAVATSTDGEVWTEALVRQEDFGGKISDTPLVISFAYYTLCRFVRLQTLAYTSLRLTYIEICAPLPHEYLGKIRNIRVTDTDILADYWHHDSYGFAWTFTCTLGMIFNARLLGVTIDRIDFRLCLRDFKDHGGDDAYLWLFEGRDRRGADLPATLPAFERHGVYASFALDVLNAYADLYFRPHARVRAFADTLAATYGLDLANTLVLLYRGTDKSIEVQPASPHDYVAVARALIARDAGLSVVCQTDQAQARDAMLAELPGAVSFRELPVTEGNLPIHGLDVAQEFGLSRSQIALRLLGMTYLVAHAKYVVTHTGNLGAWVAIYRGKPDGLYQFCEDGLLRGPDGSVLSTDLAQAGATG